MHLLRQFFWCWRCCLHVVNWHYLRLVAFLHSTGAAVAFLWRTVHISCVPKKVIFYIYWFSEDISLVEISGLHCLCRGCDALFTRLELSLEIVFVWRERVFSQFLMISLALVETFWRTLMLYLSACCRGGDTIAFAIVDVHFNLILSVCLSVSVAGW